MQVDTIDLGGGWNAEIHADEDGSYCNPRDNDCNVSTLALPGHTRYELGDDDARERYAHCESLEELAAALRDDGYTTLVPVYLLDHSGLALRCGPFHEDAGGWDSGIVGFGAMRDVDTRELAPGYTAEEAIVAEVNEYGKWLAGEVYGYIVRDPQGESPDSCWGFIGWEYVEQEARAQGAWHKNAREAEHRAEWVAAGNLDCTD